MATETELKLRLTPASARQLPAHPRLAGLASRRLVLCNTYYDTPDLALTARRIAVRFRRRGKEWLLTVKSAEPAQGGLAVRSEWECPGTPGVFDFSHVDAPELREFLDSRRAALTPVFTTDFVRRQWVIAHGHSQIELACDIGWVESCGRRSRICELELELLSGQVADLFALTMALQQGLPLHPASASKAERGYALFHDTPPQPAPWRFAGVDAGQDTVGAFRSIALACLAQYQRNENGLRSSEAPEFVHQARVALRRLRAALSLFAPVLPEGFARNWGGRWQALAAQLGEVRDRDVLLADTLPRFFPDAAEATTARRLLAHTRAARRQARRALLETLGSAAHGRLMVDFLAALYALPEGDAPPLGKFARQRLKKRASALPALCRKAKKAGPGKGGAEKRHRLRIAIKKLRYALDFFAPLLPGERQAAAVRALAGLQDVLGELNDLAVALGHLPEKAKAARTTQAALVGLCLARLPEALQRWDKDMLPLPPRQP